MRILRLVPLALLSPFLVACVTTYVKRVDNVPPPDKQPAATLMGSMIIAADDATADNLDISTAVNVLQNIQLDDFGDDTKPKLVAELERRGFRMTTDKDVAATLDFFAVTKDNEILTALAGHWVHPDGSNVDPDQFHALYLFSEDKASEVGNKLAALEGAKDKDYFAFTGVKIMQPNGCGCAGLWFWAKPRLRVNLVVVDRRGKIVYDAQGVGEGNTSVFIVDRSPSNLGFALDKAINAMQGAEVRPLKY